MKYNSRSYSQLDFPLLLTFLGEVREHIEQTHYLHVGDLAWQLFHMLASFKPSDLIRIWQDELGTWQGFALVYPPFGMFDLQVHPTFRQAELESEMLNWAQSQIISLNNPDNFYTLVNQSDNLRITMLEEQGYQPMGDWLYMQRSLTSPVAPSAVPSNFTLSDMTAVGFAARANALASAFAAPSQPELYQQFMTAPNYDPALDVVTVAANGEVASFAMCWLDPISRVGEFEPVGTVADFQRLGLGKAVLLEGMARMHQRGMSDAIVIVDASEEPACQLYESVGLVTRWKIHLYSKPSHEG